MVKFSGPRPTEMSLYEVRIYPDPHELSLEDSSQADDYIGWTFWADDVPHAVEQFMDVPAVYECYESSRWEITKVPTDEYEKKLPSMDKAVIDNLVTDIYVNVRLLELSDWEVVSPSLIADLEKAGNTIKQIVSMANGTS